MIHTDPQDKLVAILRQTGTSITRQRREVFSALLRNGPLSLRELQQLTASNMDRATLYRTVALFEKAGVLQRLNTGWKNKLELTDKFSAHHHHMTCLVCQRILVIDERQLEETINELAKRYGFQPLGHQLEIQGRCAACAGR